MNELLEEKVELKEADFRRISDIIYNHCGINLHNGKRALVRARLAKRMRDVRINQVDTYLDFALHDEAEFFKLVDSISTNLTSFFRENSHFDYLSREYLPSLIERKKKAGSHKIRFWSAGCSSGEEPYTLAIVLREFFQDLTGWDILILATDVSTRMLEQAAAGEFDDARIQPLTQQQRHRFFSTSSLTGRKVHQVRPDLKKMIRFRYLNLMEPWPFKGPFDGIFCRNVMIYFDKSTQEKLVNRFYHCLDKMGVLFIGHSESLTGINHPYKYIQPATYMKNG